MRPTLRYIALVPVLGALAAPAMAYQVTDNLDLGGAVRARWDYDPDRGIQKFGLDTAFLSAKYNSDTWIGEAQYRFGIILWATYKIFDQTNGGMAFNADFVFPINQSVNHWTTLKEVGKNMPPELALISAVNYNDARGGVSTPCLFFLIMKRLLT